MTVLEKAEAIAGAFVSASLVWVAWTWNKPISQAQLDEWQALRDPRRVKRDSALRQLAKRWRSLGRRGRMVARLNNRMG